MAKFAYVVKDSDGKTYKDVIDGSSKNAAVEKLQEQDYFIVSIKELSLSASVRRKSKDAQEARRDPAPGRNVESSGTRDGRPLLSSLSRCARLFDDAGARRARRGAASQERAD